MSARGERTRATAETGRDDALLDEVRDDADAALGAAGDRRADHIALARLVRAQELEEGAQEVCRA